MSQNLRERERERIIKGWQVCFLTCVLAIFACLAFTSAPAYADEGDGASSAELQDSDYVHVVGGTSFYNAATLPLNKTNSFTVTEARSYYYKFTLTSDGYISIPTMMTDDVIEAQNIAIYNNSQEKVWTANSSFYYKNYKLGLPKGTYYISFSHNHNKYSENSTFQMRMNFVSSNVWEKEPNDSFETANNVSVNTVCYGSGINNSKDYFKFTVSSNMSVRVAVKNTQTVGVQIFKQDLSKVKEWSMTAQSGLTVSNDATLQLSKGTYYLCIGGGYFYGTQSFDQEYSFKINATTVTSIPMYRLYNKWSGEHLFTADKNEYTNLGNRGWKQEGEAWKAPSTSGTPVYRLYNPYSGDHHYTTDKTEYSNLGNRGWKQEGIAWYSDENKGKAVYRLYNPYVTVGTHHYTTNEKEYNDLAKGGWKQESVGWYGLK